jgi:hypothetical protein
MGFRQANVATLPYAAPTAGPLMSACDARSGGVLAARHAGRLMLPRDLERFVVLTCLEPQEAGLLLPFRPLRAVDTRCAVPTGKARFPYQTVLGVGVWLP